jgi:hypothetical protein
LNLPNANFATVAEQKIKGYLLNPAHPVGGPKAAFFLRFGFEADEWERLANALIKHAQQNEVHESQPTKYGTRYAIDGPLQTPDGTILNIRSAWYIDSGGDTPRFVTAHPLPKDERYQRT